MRKNFPSARAVKKGRFGASMMIFRKRMSRRFSWRMRQGTVARRQAGAV